MTVENIVLEAENLSKRFASFSLEGLRFALARGEVMGMVGPNGAGKTTAIRLLSGLAKPDSGQARLFGKTARKGSAEHDRTGFVLDECHFYGSLSGKENARLFSSIYRKWDSARFAGLSARFGIDMKPRIDKMSRGQRVKYQLAVALSHDAELLLLDEPTSGLDPVSRSEILDLVYEFVADGKRSVLFSTHITADVEKIADRILFLREGHVVYVGETDELLESRALVKGAARQAESLRPHCEGMRITQAGFEALCLRSGLESAGFSPAEKGLELTRPTLDDVIVFSTREDYRVRAHS